MTDYRSMYRLDARPLGAGGQAEVRRAEHRRTGAQVAIKRRTNRGPEAADRMRREIQVQSAVQHANVMPILDYDDEDYAWFTMPIADGTLGDLQPPLSEDDLKTVLTDVATGLQAAHGVGFIHRDLKPSNVLKLSDGHGSRWVVADWGIVRRRDGVTTARHTRDGVFLGTEGFAPPEAYADPHSAGFSWDAYSLGRLAAWGSTGTWPPPLNDLVAPEPWRRFVRVLTESDANRRPQDMARVLELLSHVGTALPTLTGLSSQALTAAKAGDADATVAVLNAALDYADDGDFFIDDVAPLSGPGLTEFVRSQPTVVARLLEVMEHHLQTVHWGRRDFNHYNVPLRWMQRVAQAAAESGELDLLELACEALFRQEPPLDRWRQKEMSRAWIASLQGEPAARVAQLLREHIDAARYYGPLQGAADRSIRAVLQGAARPPGS